MISIIFWSKLRCIQRSKLKWCKMPIFCDISINNYWRQHNHANVLMKIKSCYDSRYIYKVSYTLYNFFFGKIGSEKFAIPPLPHPQDTMVKYYSPSEIGLTSVGLTWHGRFIKLDHFIGCLYLASNGPLKLSNVQRLNDPIKFF